MYQVHDHPDKEQCLIEGPGKSSAIPGEQEGGGPLPHAINRLLREVRRTEEEGLLTQVVVRSMAKAVYTTENIGHSRALIPVLHPLHLPIRRYPT